MLRTRLLLLLLLPVWLLSLPARGAQPSFEGRWEQGGLILGRTVPGSLVVLGDRKLYVSENGEFVFGFHRDAPDRARLSVQPPGQPPRSIEHTVRQRRYAEQRIDGLADALVNPPEGLAARIAREAEQVERARQRNTPKADFAQGFAWPARGRVKSVYGSQRILNGVPKQPHYGLDIAAAVGTPVLAAAAGEVSLAEADLYYTGGTVMIDHGGGVSSAYLHLSRLDVRPGQRLARGQRIGAIGATGRATGPHLCFRFNWFDARLDPALLLPPLPKK